MHYKGDPLPSTHSSPGVEEWLILTSKIRERNLKSEVWNIYPSSAQNMHVFWSVLS